MDYIKKRPDRLSRRVGKSENQIPKLEDERDEIIDNGGEDDGGQVVGYFDFCYAHKVGAYHYNKYGAGAGHLVYSSRGHKGRDKACQQYKTALNCEHGHRGEEDTDAKA